MGRVLFVDFEDERLAEFQTDDFNSLLEAHLELYGKKPVVFLTRCRTFHTGISLCADYLMLNIVFT